MDIISKSACVWLFPLFLRSTFDQNNIDGVIIVVTCGGIRAGFCLCFTQLSKCALAWVHDSIYPTVLH